MEVVSESFELSEPEVAVSTMKVVVDNVEEFASLATGERGLDRGALVYDDREAVNRVGGVGSEGGSDIGVDDGDKATSRGVGGGKVDCVWREDVSECREVVVRGGTNVLSTDYFIPIE